MWRPWRKKAFTESRRHSPTSSSSSFPSPGFKNLCIFLNQPQLPSIFSSEKPPLLLRSQLPPPALLKSSLPRQKCNPRAPSFSLPGGESRIVVYTTSLRVVRSTFHDCRDVRFILRGFGVPVDERDVSMHSGFLSELEIVMGRNGEEMALPRVFICGRYVGGAEEVRRLHEGGELRELVEGLPKVKVGSCVCGTCGGHRFVLCVVCDGSRKWYEEEGGGFLCCSSCNENGLIRCPSCS